MSAKKKDPNPCACILGVNEALEPKGVAVSVGTTFAGNVFPLLALESLTTQHPSRKAVVTCTYCPFCGILLQPQAVNADARRPLKLRRGLLREVGDAIDQAIELTGCHHPDVMDREREALSALRTEVLTLLRKASR